MMYNPIPRGDAPWKSNSLLPTTAIRKHRDDLLFLLNAYALDPMGGQEPLGDYTRENLCEELASRPHVFTILCYVDAEPAGICNCVEGFSTFRAKPLVNIHDIAVVAGFRGLGLSHRMLEKTEEVARGRGCCKLTLEVLQGNEVAQQSYRKFGFSGYELDPLLGKRPVLGEKTVAAFLFLTPGSVGLSVLLPCHWPDSSACSASTRNTHQNQRLPRPVKYLSWPSINSPRNQQSPGRR